MQSVLYSSLEVPSSPETRIGSERQLSDQDIGMTGHVPHERPYSLFTLFFTSMSKE